MKCNELYLFCIGGTGSKILESVTHFCAMGLGPAKIHPIVIDPDEDNGNRIRTRNLIEKYRLIRSYRDNLKPNDYFYTEISEIQNWSPLSSAMTLEDELGYKHLESNLLKLVDLFFNDNEKTLHLREGFRGHPAIGSVMMQKIKDEKFFKNIFERLKGQNKGVGFFVCASIFGGTGSSGFPVLVRLLKNSELQIPVGGGLTLPYFAIRPTEISADSKRQEIIPDSRKFLRNTSAALQFYVGQGSQYLSNYLYVFGDFKIKEIDFHRGGKDQENDAHFIDLVGASSIMNFIGNDIFENLSAPASEPTLLYTAFNDDEKEFITNKDISNLKLYNMLSFTIFSLYVKHWRNWLNKKDDDSCIKYFKKLVWTTKAELDEIITDKNDDFANELGNYSVMFLNWLFQMHRNDRNLLIFNIDNLQKYKVGELIEDMKTDLGKEFNDITAINAYIRDIKFKEHNRIHDRFIHKLSKGFNTFIKKHYHISED